MFFRSNRLVMKLPIPIVISGLLYSGSGAVIDLLLDTEVCDILPGEFHFFNLEVLPRYHNMLCCNDNIKSTFGFLDVLRSLKIKYRYIRELKVLGYIKLGDESRRLGHKNLARELDRRIDKAGLILDSIDAAAEICSEVFRAAAKGNKWILVDQGASFLYLQEPSDFEAARRVFFGARFITVVRDPSDQFAEAAKLFGPEGRREKLYKRFLGNYSGSYAERFRDWQLTILERIEKIVQSRPSDHLIVKFEDLVNHPEVQKKRIGRFLGISELNKRSKRFNPEKSKQNIGCATELLTSDELAAFDKRKIEFEDLWKRLMSEDIIHA